MVKKIYYIYRSELGDRKNEVNLLLLEKEHYVYVQNIFSILNYSSY